MTISSLLDDYFVHVLIIMSHYGILECAAILNGQKFSKLLKLVGM